MIVAGPTASGKSALALALAEALGGTVINADSMQVYRELRILTARPTPAEEARAPHRLYGVLPAAQLCSAGRWRALALAAVREAQAAGRLPIVAGGTGLYLRALMQGIAPVPDIAPAVRAAAAAEHARLGGEEFRRRLAARDPEGAARIRPSDRQRLIRAWEVIVATGRPLSAWQAMREADPENGLRDGLRFLPLLLMPPRGALYAACDARLLRMIEAGALDEVAALDRLGLDPALPAMKALGVPELRRHLAGETPLAAAVAAAQQATRNYAKRQLTWFRHQLPEARRWDAQFSESMLREILPIVRGFWLTPAG